jgi:biotin carboxyl carrier protein
MKMEIPVTATAGTIKSILVSVDDVIAEDRPSRSSRRERRRIL